MISIADLDRVLGWMLKENLQSLDVSEGSARIRLRIAAGQADRSTAPAEIVINAMALGRFLPTHPRLAEPAFRIGDRVEAGAVVGFVQNEAVLLPIISSDAGEIAELHVAAGDLLDFGAPVLTLLVDQLP
jgi:biotin carboxyl carrier protein